MQSHTQNRFSRHELFSKVLLVLGVVLLTGFVFELFLRSNGKLPGYIPRYNKGFRPVKQLEIFQSFLTDVEGVFKANPDYDWSEEFHINSDGFRSIEFERYENIATTKILFLGDSFTWGGHADPITNSFVDSVSKQGFLTFNTGIPGTDPHQYSYLAEKYIPFLNPDIVAVMFCMANDLRSPRPMFPYKNLHHITNAGWLNAFDPDGKYMSPQEAYRYYWDENNMVRYMDGKRHPLKAIAQRMLIKSVIGTYVWGGTLRIIDKFHQLRFPEENNEIIFQNAGNKHTKYYLRKIKAIAEKHHARFMLFLIPNHPARKQPQKDIMNNLYLFEEFKPFIPDFLTKEDYMKLPNGHFNNSGHQKYAEFILSSIKSQHSR